MSTCKDCVHYDLCSKTITEQYIENMLEKSVDKNCLFYKDKSSIIEKPDIVFQVGGERIYKSKVKNVIFDTDGIAFDERAIGKTVFLYKDEAERALEELKK